jgi:signal transduction histidine kinase
VEVSRQAGMAEVATSVLHNVGNVLNSVNVSTGIISNHLKSSKADNVNKVVVMLDEHGADLGAFLTHDPKGRQVPKFLNLLGAELAEEKLIMLKEVNSLAKNVDHIKDIVAMQQTYSRVSGVSETVKVTDLVEDSLSMNASALVRHEVRFIREYAEGLPEITIEKHKVLQILVNLIRNAKHACDESGVLDKRLTIRVTTANHRVRIAMADNGTGIRAEHLTRIFNHGFTTKKDGHGFGLHNAALAAKEMGGSLSVQSDGPGQGATFTLDLPCSPKPVIEDSVVALAI